MNKKAQILPHIHGQIPNVDNSLEKVIFQILYSFELTENFVNSTKKKRKSSPIFMDKSLMEKSDDLNKKYIKFSEAYGTSDFLKFYIHSN